MRCVQREAGAPRLASTLSTTGSPSRADARSADRACFRRRLLALLLAVPGLFTAAPGLIVAPTALLLGALALFHAAPAQAQATVSFEIDSLLVVETDREPEDIVVLLSAVQTQSVAVRISVAAADTTATSADYTLSATWVTFAPGETSKTFTISARADRITEGNEIVVLGLTPPTGIGLGTYSKNQIVIVDDSDANPSLNVTPGNGRLSLTWWTPPSVSADGWDVHYTSAASSSVANSATASGSDPATAWVAVTRTGVLKAQLIRPLSNGTFYRLRVRSFTLDAMNTRTSGDWFFRQGTPEQNEQTGWPPGLVPPNFQVLAGARQVTVTWDNYYGSPTGARVFIEYSKDPSQGPKRFGRNAAANTQTITNLDNGVTYYFRLYSAVWDEGASATRYSEPTEWKTATPTAAATDATLSGLTASSSTSASGTFTALTLDQSFAAGTTAYTATVPNTVDEVKLRPTVADSTATVEVGKGSTLSSVTSGTESAAISLQVGANAITVKVTAEDGSTTKTYTVTVTREEAQAQNNPAPTGLTVTPGNAQLSLSWTAPTGTLTGYDVQYTSALAASVGNSATASGNNPATAWVAVTRSGTTASQTISSLSNGTAYRVRVRAKNSNGNSAWVFGTGTPVAPAVSSTTPAAPTNLNVTPGNARLSLSWTAPTGTLTGYDVQYTSATSGSVANSAAASGSDPATAWVAVTRSGTTATQAISSLSNGTAYRVRVRARNSNGNGAWAFGTGTPLLQPTVSLSASPTR